MAARHILERTSENRTQPWLRSRRLAASVSLREVHRLERLTRRTFNGLINGPVLDNLVSVCWRVFFAAGVDVTAVGFSWLIRYGKRKCCPVSAQTFCCKNSAFVLNAGKDAFISRTLGGARGGSPADKGQRQREDEREGATAACLPHSPGNISPSLFRSISFPLLLNNPHHNGAPLRPLADGELSERWACCHRLPLCQHPNTTEAKPPRGYANVRRPWGCP